MSLLSQPNISKARESVRKTSAIFDAQPNVPKSNPMIRVKPQLPMSLLSQPNISKARESVRKTSAVFDAQPNVPKSNVAKSQSSSSTTPAATCNLDHAASGSAKSVTRRKPKEGTTEASALTIDSSSDEED